MNQNKKILLIGGGGHCASVLDCLLTNNQYAEIGIIEKSGGAVTSVLGIPVVGDDSKLPQLFDEGWKYAFIAIGSIEDTAPRRRIYARLKEIGFILPPIIDKTAVVSPFADIAEGAFVGKNAVINARANIGVCAIINTGAIVEHDCQIGNFATVSPGVVLCGSVTIGENAFIGANVTVRNNLSIGRNSVIGLGSTVTSSFPDGIKAWGTPCKEVGML